MSPNLKSAAIVCEHIAGGSPILHAQRDPSLEAEDSGWQFLCKRVVNENPEKAKVWLLEEVVKHEQSLMDYLLLPAGTELIRASISDPWEIKQTNS